MMDGWKMEEEKEGECGCRGVYVSNDGCRIDARGSRLTVFSVG